MKYLSLCFLLMAAWASAESLSTADGGKGKGSSKIPGPKIVTTVTSAQDQQRKRQRPKYHQPSSVSPTSTTLPLAPKKGETIAFIGNSLAERMIHFDHFERLLHANFPTQHLRLRNMGFPGHTPAYRPEAGRKNPWAFPDANKYRKEISAHYGTGHYPSPDEWLRIIEADTIVAFFGFNESFDGPKGVSNFKAELSAFVDHTLTKGYNSKSSPKLILATPIATENLPQFSLPQSKERNSILKSYAKAVEEVAAAKKVGFLDLFTPSSNWKNTTINGIHLSNDGYKKLSPILFEELFGRPATEQASSSLAKAIEDKNWHWVNDYRVINGVHVYGGRWAPYGNVNYPEEIEKVRQMTALRDQSIWATAQQKQFVVNDASTRPLSEIKTNYRVSEKNGALDYLAEDEALKKITMPEGYKISTFATEKQFPNLANPMQMRFDNKGRMWVSTMPSYPQYRPGDPRPDDKILIYLDEDKDGRADKEIVWADGLSIPIGFDFASEKVGGGVYLMDGSHLVHLTDTDGDDRADHKEFIVDGFDPHDSHHASSAFTTDHGGGLFMLEGRFLHSQIETPYGPQRTTDGGVWRWDPHSWRADRVLQTDVSNPWGIVFDEYGQNILNDASGGSHLWMGGYAIKMPHSKEMKKVSKFNYEHHCRPTSGSEILSSRHFPDEVQGDYIFGNTIGFRGIKQLQILEDNSEIKGRWRQDLVSSEDGNFRPADLEIAPDGSLYFLDWHNALIGHMQHSGRDPHRSSKYGRIYRVTYPSRPLVEEPKIAGASITQLFENLKIPELQTRKRSQRELRNHSAKEVIKAAEDFAKANAGNDKLALEALWATWGQQQISQTLLKTCLASEDHRIRSAAVRVLRHTRHLHDTAPYLLNAAKDSHPRVRIEALAAGSWLGGTTGAKILLTVASQGEDKWINNSLNAAMRILKPQVIELFDNGTFKKQDVKNADKLLRSALSGASAVRNHLSKENKSRYRKDKLFRQSYELGRRIFHKEGSCGTCHMDDGRGDKKTYPPIAKSPWVTGNEDRLIKLTLHGLWGKIEVNGRVYDPAKGVPPMTAVGAMFNDKEVAAVLTYVRNSWGNVAEPVSAEKVKELRDATKSRKFFYKPEELLSEHPFPTTN